MSCRMHAKQFSVVSNSNIFSLTLPIQYRYAASILNMVLLEKLDIYLYCFDLSLDLQKITYQGHSNINAEHIDGKDIWLCNCKSIE